MREQKTLRDFLELAAKRRETNSGRRLAEIAQAEGYDISHSTVNKIRKGDYLSAPTTAVLKAIAFLAKEPEEAVMSAAPRARDWRELEAVFDDWNATRERLKLLSDRYARLRGLSIASANVELHYMAQQAVDFREGRSAWHPPYADPRELRPADNVKPVPTGPEAFEQMLLEALTEAGWTPARSSDGGADFAFSGPDGTRVYVELKTPLAPLRAAARDTGQQSEGRRLREEQDHAAEHGQELESDVAAQVVESLQTYLPSVSEEDDDAAREAISRGAAELDLIVLSLLEDQAEMDPSIDFADEYRRQRKALDPIIHTPAGQEALLRLAESVIRDSLGKLEVSEVARNYQKFLNVVDDAPPLTQTEVEAARRAAREMPLAARDTGSISEGRRLRNEQDEAAEAPDG